MGVGAPSARTAILQNFSVEGGGIFATGSLTRVEMSYAEIIGNQASVQGGGVLVEEGAYLELLAPAFPCHDGSCNLLGYNQSQAFSVNFASMRLESTTIWRNQGSLSGIGNAFDSQVELSGCLVYDNENDGGGPGISLHTLAHLRLIGTTFADQIAMGTLIGGSSDSTVDADGLILAGYPWDFAEPQMNWDLDCSVLTHDPGLPLPGVTGVIIADPKFRIPYIDYHILPDSPARDLCLPPGIVHRHQWPVPADGCPRRRRWRRARRRAVQRRLRVGRPGLLVRALASPGWLVLQPPRPVRDKGDRRSGCPLGVG